MNAKIAKTMSMKPIMFQQYSGTLTAVLTAYAIVVTAGERKPEQITIEVFL